MAGVRVYGGSNMTLLVQNEGIPCSSEALEALLISSSSSSSAFNGSRSMVSFEDVHGGKTRDRSFFRSIDQEDNGDEEFDECFHQPEKKRRLTVDQVQFLEKNFEVENKLEPERKIQIARELGLQPRQVAIWFQNRRARWKTKQLEKDYESLNASFNSLKSDYEKILKEKETLKNEVLTLTEKLLPKEKEKEESKPSYTNKPSSPNPEKPVSNSVSEEKLSSLLVCKQEDLSSANSGIFDSDSPHYADSSHVFEPENSDLSQDEEDNLSKNFLHLPFIFPKLEDGIYPDPPANYCNYGFSVEDQAPWFWSY